MSEVYATPREPSLSLPIRLEKKRKATRVGAVAVGVGVVMLGGAVYNFGRSGSVLIAIYLAILASCLLSFGTTRLIRASHS